jgi:aldose sugar dehydrogenase
VKIEVITMEDVLIKRRIWIFLPLVVLMGSLTLGACGVNPAISGVTTATASVTAQTSTTTATTSTTAPTSETTRPISTSQPTPTPTERILLPPVETNPPNTTYSPAFSGQTRAPGTLTKTPYTVTLLTEALSSPWAVTALPDNRLVITEKAGKLRLVAADGTISQPIGGFPRVDSRNQGGLLDVAPAPDFLTSRMLYFTLAESTSKGSLTAVGRGRLAQDESRIEDFSLIWRATPYYDNSMHFGSRLAFDPTGYLFVTTGERSDLVTRPKAQLLDNGYGKVVRLAADGTPAPGNPFIGVAGTMPEIYSYGHRNVQGLAIQPETGAIWISEMGPRGGDELNLIKNGGNYGWPVISYGIEYSGAPVPGALTVKEGMEQPVYYWDPVLAPSGMTFYTSGVIAEWQGNLFIGGLKGQHIARLVIENGRVVAEERLLADEGQRFRDVGEGNDGALYAVTDSGRLYKIG